MANERDYVKIAIDYATRATKDGRGKEFGLLAKQAASRFLKDLQRAKRKRKPPFLFDKNAAFDACDFLDKLPHVEGNWETDAIVWSEPYVFMTVNVFGFRKHDGTRRYSDALLAIARKNAKSTYAAGIGLYCLTCEGENGPQVITGATTGQQARIVFNIAKSMVTKTTDLQEAFMVEPMANAIPCWSNGGTYKPINAKASTQDGLNPSTTILDEIHAHPNHDLINVLKSAAGARANPLRLFTTTEGYQNAGPWAELRKFAKNVLAGAVVADHFFVLYFAIDEKDNEFDSEKWIKANPLMLVNPVLKAEIEKEAIEAKHMPGKVAEFRIKRCNRESAAAGSWVNLAKWKKCNAPLDMDLLKTLPCYGAFDLASTTDFVAWVLYWRAGDQGYALPRFWLPSSALDSRTSIGTINYQSWVESGLVTVTEGDVTDYEVVRKQIIEDCGLFNVVSVAYDPWNATDTVNQLTEHEIPLVQFRQGPASYHPAMQELERQYIKGNFSHGGNPVLQWMAANLVPRYDANMNMAPDKKKSADKIDGMAALLMAVGISMNDEHKIIGDEYELVCV